MKTWRIWHRWVSVVVAFPFLVIVSTGLILSTRAYNTWMQPRYAASSSPELHVTFPQMLAAVRTRPEAKMLSWDDVSQIDVRPKNGQIRVRSKHDHWEVQLDSATGEVLGVAQRRVSWFVSLHEGALFGPWVRYGIFFPSAFGVFFLLVSGLWIFLQPYWRRARAGRA
jgi:uncharacterized iron-regulated membrane protein